ncbi:MAG: hypothetical protein Q7K57_11930 [Burkholderiaceae bacterium]|nr:hypothetical protein [Burkholderiaceae bacterium]
MSKKPNQAPVADDQNWKALDSDWIELENTRSLRGNKLSALALGFRPVKGLLAILPATERKELSDLRSLIKATASDKKAPGKLQYDLASDDDGKKRNSSLSSNNRAFDVVTFVDFLRSLPRPKHIDERLIKAADYWRSIEGEDQGAKPSSQMPKNVSHAADTRRENTLLETLLGLAIVHYGYIPGEDGSKESRDQRKLIYARMAADLEKVGMRVNAPTIGKNLERACELPILQKKISGIAVKCSF